MCSESSSKQWLFIGNINIQARMYFDFRYYYIAEILDLKVYNQSAVLS